MSWNTSRILNDLEYEINVNKQDISVLEQKTLYISDQLSVDGTVFLNNVYSEAFVKNGGTSSQYLMADGSTTTNSQQGQPNIYLYNNNNSGTPEPASGQIRANDPNNQNVTELYISQITSDGIDIDVFLQQISTISVIYMQDRNNSNNNVRFNVTGAIIDNPNLYVTVPVVFDIAQGSGAIDFGDGHPLFMSIFDNSQLIDSRISAVETKTQHITANSDVTNFNSTVNMNNNQLANVKYPISIQDCATKGYVDTSIQDLNLSQYTPLSDFNNLASTVTTQGQYINELEVVTQNINATSTVNTITKTTNVKLDEFDAFNVSDLLAFNPILILNNTSAYLYKRLDMEGQPIINCDSITLNGGLSNQFLKADGTLDSNTYLQSADLSALESKTQNITGSTTLNTFTQGSIFKLSAGQNFTISDDGSPFGVTKLIVNNTGISALLPLTMNNNKITSLGTPSLDTDATTKKYVDDFNTALISNITTLQNKTQNIVASDVINTITKSSQFKLSNSQLFSVTDDSGPFVSVRKFAVTNAKIDAEVPMSMNLYQLSGIPTPIDDDQCPNKLYVDTQNSSKLSLSGGVLTGSVTATSFIQTGGTYREFLKANGDVAAFENVKSQRLNHLYYNPTTDLTSYSMNMDSWRYCSWGYSGLTVIVVDTPTASITHQGGSLAAIGVNGTILPKGFKLRTGSNVSSNVNGAVSGWLGTVNQYFLSPRAGWHIKIGFTLDATTTTSFNRTMVGLFQSTARPTLDSTNTIAAVTIGSMGIVQELGETVFSFNTRGTSGSTKIPTTISCQTPNNNWYMLEMINEPNSTTITLILTCQTNVDIQTASATFICGGANTMPLNFSYIHLQQNMATAGAPAGSCGIALGNVGMRLAQ